LAVALIALVAAAGLSARSRRAEEKAARLLERVALLEERLSIADSRIKAAGTGAAADENVEAERSRAGRATNSVDGTAQAGSDTNRPPRQRESFEERMARMKEEDPEGYEEMIAQRLERRERMRYGLAERTASFMDLDTSRMTETELANHEQLVEKMARVWELTDQFPDPDEPPDREIMREMFGIMREVQPMLDQERNVMFKQLGSDLGYEGGEAEEFAAYVEEIIDITSMRSPFSGGRRGGGDRRSDGGRRGGGDRRSDDGQGR
jgi:hypothetical protein